jgi:ParB/RepB/Spo0J family partition protein
MDDSKRTRVSNICTVNPFECRMWAGHIRMRELVTEESCREEIDSFLQHGQKQPVLGRPIRGDSAYRVELVYGARRLFVAQHLNAGLLVDIREMDDREAFVEMDVENRLRKEVSPYERGMAYKDWLREGYFKSQKDIASALGISAAQVSRLLRFAELPAVVIRAFGRQENIRETWASMLADRCMEPVVKQRMTAVARSLATARNDFGPEDTFKLLLDCEDPQRRLRVTRTDTVIRSSKGEPLFRISWRNNEVHIVVPRERAQSAAIEGVSRVLRDLIESTVEGSVARLNSALNRRTGRSQMARPARAANGGALPVVGSSD